MPPVSNEEKIALNHSGIIFVKCRIVAWQKKSKNNK
jgi:hypothetical protein